MKISILQGPFLPVPPLRGGAVEKMWFELGAEFAARGHDVTHVSRLCDDLAAEETLRGVRHLRVAGFDRSNGGGMPGHLLRDFIYTWRAARRAPDAAVTVTNSFWGPVLLRRRHGAIYVDVQRMPKGQMRLYGRAARLRANSSAVREAILAEVPQREPAVRVIPNSLPFVPARPVDWARKERTILFAGRIHPEKGIELLLEAWSLRRRAGRFNGWKLVLVGPIKESEGGGGEAWVKSLQTRFPAEDVVWREPIYDIAQLNALYESASVFAYPSVAAKGETFGLAVLEAMAWGAVPVVSELACFRDFVTENRNGFFFDHNSGTAAGRLGEALERATQPAAHAVAERAVAVRESHSGSSIASQFLEDFARFT